MLGWDRQLADWVVGHRVGALDPVAKALTFAGTYGVVWLAIAVLLAVLRRRPEIVAWTAVADLLAIVSSTALKDATDRPRPDVHAIVPEPSTSSFPSGHATGSFACALVLVAFAPRLAAPLVVLAAAIAWSRVYVGVHYPLDVIAGAVLGGLLALLVLRALRPLAADLRRSRRRTRSG